MTGDLATMGWLEDFLRLTVFRFGRAASGRLLLVIHTHDARGAEAADIGPIEAVTK